MKNGFISIVGLLFQQTKLMVVGPRTSCETRGQTRQVESIIHIDLVPNNRSIHAHLYFAQPDWILLCAVSWEVNTDFCQQQVNSAAAKHTYEGKNLRLIFTFSGRWRYFKTLDDIETECRELFVSKDKSWYSHGIKYGFETPIDGAAQV